MGSSIDEAFGMNIHKKRNKKKDKLNVVNPSRLDPEIRHNIHGFDTNFQNSSNTINANDNYDFHLLDQQDDYLGSYHPYNIQFNQQHQQHQQHHHENQHTVKQLPPPPPPSNINVEQHPSPPPPIAEVNNNNNNTQPTFRGPSVSRNSPHNTNIQPNRNRPSEMNRNIIPRNANSINISQNEYNELLNYRNQINQKQYELSQNLTEGFTNINDDFNDLLLFALLGIFFLIFTDYIYKMGKKSY